MLRVLLFIIVVAAFGIGFAWLAETPGTVVMTIAGREVSFTLMVAAVALVAVVVAIMVTWWLVRVILTSPQRMQRFFRARRRDRGYQSLSTGIIAAGAGDSITARRMLKQAGGLLSATTEPMLQLLDAQASMVEGDHEAARGKFEAMLADPEMRMLGLRGLYMEAKRLGDRDAAKHYAERAAELAPHLGWAGNAALELKTTSGDWDGAIRLLDSQKSAKQVDRDDAKRKRAVLLTALAMDVLEKDPAKAKHAALEAHKLAPEFAPAAVTAAQAAFRLNDMRKGVSVLEQTWRKAPHPDVAAAYIDARPGDSALDRYKRARRLEQLKPNNIVTSMIVAQMALEAGEYEDARKAVAAVLRNEPREGAFMLMADIEDAETGDQGKVREWLARAVRAQRDPAWTADGYVSEKWAPISPISGRLDAFEWKVPVERLGPVVENDLDPMVPGISATHEAAEPVREEPDALVVDHEPAPAKKQAEPVSDIEVVPAEAEPVAKKQPAAKAEVIETESPPVRKPEKMQPDPTEPVSIKTAEEKVPEPPKAAAAPVVAEKPATGPVESGEADGDGKGGNPPVPDDPGIDVNEEPDEPKRRFRLF